MLHTVHCTFVYTGEVRLFNTALEVDPLISQSGYSEIGHKEPLVQVMIQ